jgi:type III secretory pathway component EscV
MTYTFTTNDETEARKMMNGWKYEAVLSDLDNEMRRLSKHTEQTEIGIDEVRQMITRLCDDYGVSIFE